MPYAVIIYGEFTTLLVDRTIATGTSSETKILQWFGGGRVLWVLTTDNPQKRIQLNLQIFRTNASKEETYDAIIEDSVAFGIGSFVGSFVVLIFAAISIDILNYTAHQQIKRIRILFFKSILKQDMIWYDTNTEDNFAVRVTEDLEKLKEGIGEKLSICLNLVMAFVISVAVSFFYGKF